jgi:hypothetical protein
MLLMMPRRQPPSAALASFDLDFHIGRGCGLNSRRGRRDLVAANVDVGKTVVAGAVCFALRRDSGLKIVKFDFYAWDRRVGGVVDSPNHAARLKLRKGVTNKDK